ncbi:MAG: hypothetical protein RI841_07455 [Halomonas sp.]|uniref:hypothetical protein n=1 Tax=Halomonas sp. TaxID=1486246 RepID=UPI0028701981|nr:hypothetical protein [Halomonas sp.]MDR9439318.1 hypothetical protein [Halomonas sp.]
MVVTIRRLAMVTLALLPGAALAQATGSLSDAWLTTLRQHQGPASWSHAVVLREATRDALPARQARLQAELDTLVASARLSGAGGLGHGLAAWRARVANADSERSRTPGRHDLPWIAANLRRDLAMRDVARWGLCEPPSWVELWHYRGITRLAWQPGLTLPGALAALPNAARQGVSRAAVVTPVGDVEPRGAARWNRDATPLAAGSRVVLGLPENQGLRAAMPFPGTVEEAGWVNERLPAFLATRLPGDECALSEK